MTSPIPQQAWQLACRLFIGGHAVMESFFRASQLPALRFLKEKKAVELAPQTMRDILCPWCREERGIVAFINNRRVCVCPVCGEVELRDADFRAWRLKPEWLEMSIASAFGLPVGIHSQVAHGVAMLGAYRKHPVVVTHGISTFLLNQDFIKAVRTKGCLEPFVVAPLYRGQEVHPLGVVHVPLETQFAFSVQGLRFIDHTLEDALPDNAPCPVNGPFSEDFVWYFADGQVPLSFTPAQAAILRILWKLEGAPARGEDLLRKAGLDTDKIGDLFKVKTRDKGKELYERRFQTYRLLVHSKHREGLYWMTESGFRC